MKYKIQLAEGRQVTIQNAAAPFQMKLGIISLTVSGSVMEEISHDVVTGLPWLQKNKPHTNWDTSVLTVQQHGILFQVYSKKVDLLLRDTVFLYRQVQGKGKEQRDQMKKFRLQAFQHSYQTKKSDHSHWKYLQISREYSPVFAEKLKGISPKRAIEHSIQLQGSMPKPTPLYQLTKKEEEALQEHLKEALA